MRAIRKLPAGYKSFLDARRHGYSTARSRGSWDARLAAPSRGAQGLAKNFGDYYRENIGEGGRCRPGMGRSRRRGPPF